MGAVHFFFPKSHPFEVSVASVLAPARAPAPAGDEELTLKLRVREGHLKLLIPHEQLPFPLCFSRSTI
jgi:hypothetical protein